MADKKPELFIIAGPNGSEKTTVNLEKFKKAVENRLLELNRGDTTEVNAILATMTDEIWQDYMNDFSDSPQGITTVAGGLDSGLI